MRRYILMLAIAIAAIGTNAIALPPTDSGVTTICYEKQLWDGNDKNRPCARITNVMEDGSVAINVFDRDGDMRYRDIIGPPNIKH